MKHILTIAGSDSGGGADEEVPSGERLPGGFLYPLHYEYDDRRLHLEVHLHEGLRDDV